MVAARTSAVAEATPSADTVAGEVHTSAVEEAVTSAAVAVAVISAVEEVATSEAAVAVTPAVAAATAAVITAKSVSSYKKERQAPNLPLFVSQLGFEAT